MGYEGQGKYEEDGCAKGRFDLRGWHWDGSGFPITVDLDRTGVYPQHLRTEN